MSGGALNLISSEMPVSYVAPPHDPTTKELAVEAARKARHTGAAIRRNHLVIATVQGSSSSGFSLVHEQSAQIELLDRDQESLRYFQEDVKAFVVDAGIEKMLLRSLPETGKFRTNYGYKIEAVAQLVPNLAVEIIHFNTIEKWKRHSGALAPRPIDNLFKWEEEAHRNAIAAACYAEMHGGSCNAPREQ